MYSVTMEASATTATAAGTTVQHWTVIPRHQFSRSPTLSKTNIHWSSIAPAFLVFFSFLLLTVPVGRAADIFASVAELPRVLVAEANLAEQLKHYVNREQERLDRLRKIAEDFSNHSVQGLTDPDRYIGNPVSAYLLIKRFASDWAKIIEKDIKSNATEDQDDLKGAATALMRLQDIYSLSTERLARGELQGIEYSPRMTAEDCFKLGTVAYNKHDYYHTILWMDQALKTVEQEIEQTISKATVLDFLSYSVYMQGNIRRALNLTIQWLELEPDHIRAQNNRGYFEKMMKEKEALYGAPDPSSPSSSSSSSPDDVVNERPRDTYQKSEFFKNYERLCRGEKTHVHTFDNRLKCQYRRHHPFLYIRPAREEVIHLKPRMVMYHDILSETEVQRIKDLAYPRLFRSVVYHEKGQSATSTQDYRISKSAWLKDSEDSVIAGISRKAAICSNLSLSTAEELQVLNYGIGGHYEPHYDFATGRVLSQFEQQIGNRIATFICYASDVLAGGATVFPEIGVQLFPEKGACVLWYNLKKNGEGDMLTRHAGCPVLTGSKWAANKWFHERGQEFLRQCDASQDFYE